MLVDRVSASGRGFGRGELHRRDRGVGFDARGTVPWQPGFAGVSPFGAPLSQRRFRRHLVLVRHGQSDVERVSPQGFAQSVISEDGGSRWSLR